MTKQTHDHPASAIPKAEARARLERFRHDAANTIPGEPTNENGLLTTSQSCSGHGRSNDEGRAYVSFYSTLAPTETVTRIIEPLLHRFSDVVCEVRTDQPGQLHYVLWFDNETWTEPMAFLSELRPDVCVFEWLDDEDRDPEAPREVGVEDVLDAAYELINGRDQGWDTKERRRLRREKGVVFMTRREREPVHIHDVTAIRDSGKALLCNIDGDEIWIPHSQVHDDSEVFDAEENAEGTLVITAWLAEQKGLA